MLTLPRVLISYAHEDEQSARALQARLMDVASIVLVEPTALPPYAHLLAPIRSHVHAFDVLVLMLSQHSLWSQSWANDQFAFEITSELRRGTALVVPVRLHPIPIPDYLSHWRTINATTHPERAFETIASMVTLYPRINPEAISPMALEDLAGDLLRAYGFRNIQRSVSSKAGQFDFVARYRERDPFGGTRLAEWIVEVRSGQRQTSLGALNAFVGTLAVRKAKGLFVTSSLLTTPFRESLEEVERRAGVSIIVLDGADIRRLVAAKPRLVTKHFPLHELDA